jgi:hypothetical protein
MRPETDALRAAGQKIQGGQRLVKRLRGIEG